VTAPAGAGTVIGTIGALWRATVTPWGAVELTDGTAPLDWWIAADDRWHDPRTETAVRQRRIEGTPVVETRLRIPDGHAVQRVYAVPDGGGLVVVEIENQSPLPLMVAFSRPDLLCAHPARPVPAAGIDLPAGAVAVPVGHRTSARVALAVHGRIAALPPGLPAPDQVARGWLAQLEHGLRVVLPDAAIGEALVAARCDALLARVPVEAGDPVAVLLTAAERCAHGDDPQAWVVPVANAVEVALTSAGRARQAAWDVAASLPAAMRVFAAAGEERAAADVRRAARMLAPMPAPAEMPEGIRRVAWVAALVVAPTEDGVDLVPGMRAEWFGQSVEVHGAPAGEGVVSFAIRWHGERPAVLWECHPPVALTCRSLDPSWRAAPAGAGDTLLAAPRR